jgi:polyferredoxin
VSTEKGRQECHNCRFCSWAYEEETHWCLRYPPMRNVKADAIMAPVSGSVEVARHGWCGEWEWGEGRGEWQKRRGE